MLESVYSCLLVTENEKNFYKITDRYTMGVKDYLGRLGRAIDSAYEVQILTLSRTLISRKVCASSMLRWKLPER